MSLNSMQNIVNNDYDDVEESTTINDIDDDAEEGDMNAMLAASKRRVADIEEQLCNSYNNLNEILSTFRKDEILSGQIVNDPEYTIKMKMLGDCMGNDVYMDTKPDILQKDEQNDDDDDGLIEQAYLMMQQLDEQLLKLDPTYNKSKHRENNENTFNSMIVVDNHYHGIVKHHESTRTLLPSQVEKRLQVLLSDDSHIIFELNPFRQGEDVEKKREIDEILLNNFHHSNAIESTMKLSSHQMTIDQINAKLVVLSHRRFTTIDKKQINNLIIKAQHELDCSNRLQITYPK